MITTSLHHISTIKPTLTDSESVRSKITLIFRERDEITARALRLTTYNLKLSRAEKDEWKPNCVGSSKCFAHGSQQLSNFKEMSVMPLRVRAGAHLRFTTTSKCAQRMLMCSRRRPVHGRHRPETQDVRSVRVWCRSAFIQPVFPLCSYQLIMIFSQSLEAWTHLWFPLWNADSPLHFVTDHHLCFFDDYLPVSSVCVGMMRLFFMMFESVTNSQQWYTWLNNIRYAWSTAWREQLIRHRCWWSTGNAGKWLQDLSSVRSNSPHYGL